MSPSAWHIGGGGLSAETLRDIGLQPKLADRFANADCENGSFTWAHWQLMPVGLSATEVVPLGILRATHRYLVTPEVESMLRTMRSGHQLGQ